MTEPACLDVELVERCPCGRPLHYEDPRAEDLVRRLVAELGPTQEVRTPAGAWRVPRHYTALHGFTAQRLPELARLHGWQQLEGRRR